MQRSAVLEAKFIEFFIISDSVNVLVPVSVFKNDVMVRVWHSV